MPVGESLDVLVRVAVEELELLGVGELVMLGRSPDGMN
ncbi:hypothetical protein SDC9_208437 [bioreactor metagenome]|uniref:Uncharacterized protein n=1 Tax=bioreactor metagenome TaxID=1076179 RepID=A0A645JB98_9ZZZZ